MKNVQKEGGLRMLAGKLRLRKKKMKERVMDHAGKKKQIQESKEGPSFPAYSRGGRHNGSHVIAPFIKEWIRFLSEEGLPSVRGKFQHFLMDSSIVG